MEASWTSILPAVIAIAFALATRQVIVALFAGILSASVIVLVDPPPPHADGTPVQPNPITEFFFDAVGTEGFAQILLIYLWSLGGLIGVWSKTGGARHFAETAGRRLAKGPRSSLFFSWLIGIVFHQGGTISTVLAGTTVKPVTDRHRVSHEELSYVVDSTASPIATVIPFNAWPTYIGGLAVGTIAFLPDEDSAVAFFFESIVFNFYGVLAVVGTLLFALGWLPFLFPMMRKAVERARTSGELDAPCAEPMLQTDVELSHAQGYQPSLADFLVPMAVLLGFMIVPYALGQNPWTNEAFALSVLSAMATAKLRGMRLTTIVDGFVDGCQRMTIGAIVLALAVTLGQVSKDLQTAAWVSSAISDGIDPIWLPALLTGLCMVIAFASGSSWATYAVVVPVALPVAYGLSPDPTYVSICFGAVIGGAVFGDQCSPISDTTVLSSMFTGCDLMDHVRTQLPMALTAAGIGAVASTVCAAVL